METHSIKNNQLSISVNTFGAELCSVKNKEGEELIWQADKGIWARHAPVLFPIVGKLKNNHFNFDNKTYSLPQHGFARDNEFVLLEESENVLEFELTATEETLINYPFHFSLRIRYELNGSTLKTKYIVFNPNNSILPFSIGAHPGFNFNLIDDAYLEFKNKTELTIQKLSNGLVSNETYSIPLQNGILKLSPDLFLNDALVLKNTQINEVLLCSEKSKRQVKLHCQNWPFFGIWTKKDNTDFVCLEPWHGVTDGINADGSIMEKEGIIVLESNRSFETEFGLDFV